ncbi:DUF7305 domain-containing protein [Alicyclobacillus sp. ALC3]|uniref:DUF7305 domain-containing protein n=1 Tax=Alicyclobacillus sp. ALC3 TaxID=2796143 RepID=UPI0023799441|nr:pilus assembly protein TadG-related protein [Alicyclobacillus sp. ALC3]WDL96072.1 hypothetical protein JC200_17255 [Alicyclobacillus sp. ALC3]
MRLGQGKYATKTDIVQTFNIKKSVRVLTWINRTEGQSLVLTGLIILGLLGTAGVSVSIATVYYTQSTLQSAVDSAALAGAQLASQGGTAASQSGLIEQNDPHATGQVWINASTPSHVNAEASQTVSGGFAALFGFSSFHVAARAVASFGPGSPFNYAVFQGSTNLDQPLTFNGNDSVQYVQSQIGPSGANVYSNGNVQVNGSVTITGNAGAAGDVSIKGGASVHSIANNQPILSMPVWPTPNLPDTSTWQVVSSLPSNATLSANYIIEGNGTSVSLQGDTITGAIMVTNGASLTLSGGTTINGNLYASGGGSISLTGQNQVNGNIDVVNNASSPSDITIGASTVTGSIIDVGGNVTLSGNASAGSSPGLTIGAFAVNGVGGNVTVEGGVSTSGVVYAPDGTITFDGNDTLSGSAVGLYDTLNGNITVSYDSAVVQNVPFRQVALIR